MTLGQDLAQCCGGVVDLWLERLTRDDRLWLMAAARLPRSGAALLTTRATHSQPESATHSRLERACSRSWCR